MIAETKKTNAPEKGGAKARRRVVRLAENKPALVGLALLLIMIAAAILADFVAPYPYDQQDLQNTLQFPSLAHLFGTDEFGRDVLSRIIYGARISLLVGFVSVLLAAVVGIPVGICAAYYGQTADNVIMRFVDVLMSIPQILLAISIVSALGPGIGNLMIAISISAIPAYARTARACTLSVKNKPYIESARIAGSGDLRIILRHILPNILGPLSVQAMLGVASSIICASGLSFIGLGVQPPIPEWGSMLSTGRNYIRDSWYLTLFPGLAITGTILSLNLLGDGMRDLFDPVMER